MGVNNLETKTVELLKKGMVLEKKAIASRREYLDYKKQAIETRLQLLQLKNLDTEKQDLFLYELICETINSLKLVNSQLETHDKILDSIV